MITAAGVAIMICISSCGNTDNVNQDTGEMKDTSTANKVEEPEKKKKNRFFHRKKEEKKETE